MKCIGLDIDKSQKSPKEPKKPVFLMTTMLSNILLVSAAALLGSLSAVKADSEEFGLISIRSGSALQYASVLINTDNESDGYYPINVGSDSDMNWEYVITDEGHLVANDTYYWAIIPNSDGQYGATKDSSKAVNGFSIADGNLASSKDYSFEAVPDGSSWDLYSQNANGKNGNTASNLGLALACYTTNGFAADYTPGSSSNSSSSNSTSSAADNSTATTLATLATLDNSTATTLAPVDNSTAVPPAVITSVRSTSVSGSSTKIISSTTAVSHNSTANSTSSTTKGSSSSSSQKNGADSTKGSVSLLIMGLAGLFL